VPAKVTKLIGLKRPPFLSPTNLVTFAITQNGELIHNGTVRAGDLVTLKLDCGAIL
jgi:hypothetical protein